VLALGLPYREVATLRGIGVGLIHDICGEFRNHDHLRKKRGLDSVIDQGSGRGLDSLIGIG
jgi:hypothetical protein